MEGAHMRKLRDAGGKSVLLCSTQKRRESNNVYELRCAQYAALMTVGKALGPTSSIPACWAVDNQPPVIKSLEFSRERRRVRNLRMVWLRPYLIGIFEFGRHIDAASSPSNACMMHNFFHHEMRMDCRILQWHVLVRVTQIHCQGPGGAFRMDTDGNALMLLRPGPLHSLLLGSLFNGIQ